MKLLLTAIVCATALSVDKPNHTETRINFLKDIKVWYCNVIPSAIQIFDCQHGKSIHEMKNFTKKTEMKEAKSVFCHTDIQKSNNSHLRCNNYNSTHDIVLTTDIKVKYNILNDSFINTSEKQSQYFPLDEKVEQNIQNNVTFDNVTTGSSSSL